MTRPETISSNFWRSDYPYKICLSWIPIHVATYNSSEKKLFVDVVGQVICKNSKFETNSCGLQP